MKMFFSPFLVLGLAGCATAPSENNRTCLEGICLVLPPGTNVTNDGHKHTVRVDGWHAWLDVQQLDSGRNSPTELTDILGLIRRRMELENATVLDARVTSLAGQPLAMTETRITRQSGTYRRRLFVGRTVSQTTSNEINSQGQTGHWIAVDITALDADFALDEQRLVRVLDTAVWNSAGGNT